MNFGEWQFCNYVQQCQRAGVTAGDLPQASSHGRGHLRCRAGVEKAPAWLPCASEPRYLALVVAVRPRFLALLFPSPLPNSDEPVSSP